MVSFDASNRLILRWQVVQELRRKRLLITHITAAPGRRWFVNGASVSWPRMVSTVRLKFGIKSELISRRQPPSTRPSPEAKSGAGDGKEDDYDKHDNHPGGNT
jgi:hypothetical protein